MGRESSRIGVSKKPPKLRFRPGWFVRKKSSGQLYCIVWVYRLVTDPGTWLFTLEERVDTSDPSTVVSIYCEAIAGTINLNERILWQPVTDISSRCYPQDYCHGDREIVNNKRMINDFEVIERR